MALCARITPTKLKLRTRTRGYSQWSMLQRLHHGAQIDRFRIVSLVLGNLSPVHHFEPITFKHLFAASALEGDDLSVNSFFAASIEVTQIRTHQRTGGGNFSGARQKIDVEMRRAPRRGRHFPPSMHQCPPNKSPRTTVVMEIPAECAQK